MQIREATLNDSEEIKKIHLQAFDDAENRIVAEFAVKLLSDRSLGKTHSLIAIQDEDIIGHIAFSPVILEQGGRHFAYILAPLAVSPEHQHAKVGSSLVKFGLNLIAEQGSFLVFVYGDPKYYSRFGFQTELAANFPPRYPLKYPEGWHALKIGDADLPTGGRIRCVESLDDPDLW